jgi:hypothetical protein
MNLPMTLLKGHPRPAPGGGVAANNLWSWEPEVKPIV